MISSVYVSGILFGAFSHAFVHNVPRQTSVAEELFDPQGWTPRPTSSPNSPLNLFQRQVFPNDAGTVLIAPDNTCGYISGLQGAPFTCNTKYKCLFFSATGSNYGPIACCTTGMSCKIRTACVESTDYFGTASNSFCDDGCRMDIYTLKCTDRLEPYCGGVRFTSPNIQDYWCVTSPVSTWHSAATTFIGQTEQHVFSTVDRSAIWGTTSSSSSQSSSTLPPDASPDGPGSTPTPSPPSPTPTDEGSGTPVGAIIGGVLGGVALLTAIAFGAFVLWRKYGRKNSQGQPPPTQDPYAYAGPSEMDIASGGARHSYVMATSPHSYNAEPISQHYDPPKAPAPQELYSPPIFQQQYHQVPMESPDGHGFYYPNDQSLTPNTDMDTRHLSMTSATTSDTAVGGYPPIPPKIL